MSSFTFQRERLAPGGGGRRLALDGRRPGWLRRSWRACTGWAFRRPLGPHDVPSGCAALADEATDALRAGDLASAAERLDEVTTAWPTARRWARYCNLCGALHELWRDHREARRWYGRAIAADRRFPAAQVNMRRQYELAQFGRSDRPILLGDEGVTL